MRCARSTSQRGRRSWPLPCSPRRWPAYSPERASGREGPGPRRRGARRHGRCLLQREAAQAALRVESHKQAAGDVAPDERVAARVGRGRLGEGRREDEVAAVATELLRPHLLADPLAKELALADGRLGDGGRDLLEEDLLSRGCGCREGAGSPWPARAGRHVVQQREDECDEGLQVRLEREAEARLAPHREREPVRRQLETEVRHAQRRRVRGRTVDDEADRQRGTLRRTAKPATVRGLRHALWGRASGGRRPRASALRCAPITGASARWCTWGGGGGLRRGGARG